MTTMKKSTYWIIWSLAFIVINIGAFPIAAFSLFGTLEGTSIFSLDYVIALSILLLPNIVSLQLFIALRKQDQKGFLFGLLLAIMEASAFILLFYHFDAFYICLALALIIISIIGALVLLLTSKKTIKS